jgi:hypothetical protein
MRRQIVRFTKLVIASVVLTLTLSTLAGAGPRRPTTQLYRIQTMGSLQMSLPVAEDTAEVMYRDARGEWRVLDGCIQGGVLRFDLDLADICNGRTMLLLDPPKWVNLDDQQPPEVIRFEIDGISYGPISSVAMGGVDVAPEQLLLEVEDKDNWLRTRSLSVNAAGKAHGLSHPAIALERINSRHAIITADLKHLMGTIGSQNSVMVCIDDYALDDDALCCTLSFRYEAPHVLDNGWKVAIDSVTGSSGWAEWWVMFDGFKMDASGGTTAGFTWLSEGNAQPHWVRIEFPEPREVSEVDIWWAYYQGYRASTAYKIQTWESGKWVTQLDISNQKSAQVSKHTFKPVTTKAIRIWQPAMAGHPIEPQYMWISEIEVGP